MRLCEGWGLLKYIYTPHAASTIDRSFGIVNWDHDRSQRVVQIMPCWGRESKSESQNPREHRHIGKIRLTDMKETIANVGL